MSIKTIISKLPNCITIARVFGSIFMILYYEFGKCYIYEILWLIFTICSISDFFDGYLSRKFNAHSNFGKCFDPISDKLLLITGLLILAHARMLHTLVAFVLMGREIIISGLREFLSLERITLPVSRLAKWKTVFQMFAIAICFFLKADAVIAMYNTYLGDYILLHPLTFMILHAEIVCNIVLSLAVYTTLHTGALYIYSSSKYLK